MKKRSQSGMAVIVAILLVALAASAAAFMLSQQDLWTRQVESLRSRAQADAAARAGIEWARRALADSSLVPDPVQVQATAAGVIAHLSLPDTALDISYSDAQGLFNLNNLVRADRASEADVQVFQRMLAAAAISPETANAVVDALDGDSETRLPGGAEDLDYLAMDPPRRAANRPMLDTAQLARVRGFSAAAVARLKLYLSALPEATVINVNSAPAEILMLIAPGLDVEGAQRLIATREEKIFSDAADFRARLPEKAALTPGIAIGFSSRYFIVSSRARSGRAEVTYQALIGRKGAAQAGVIWVKPGDA